MEYDAKAISLTEKGIQALGALATRPTSNAALHEMIIKSLKGKQVRMFGILANGETYKKDNVAKQLDYEDSKVKAFVNLIGGMRGKSIVEYPDKNTVRLTDGCFVEPRGEA